MYTGMDVKLNIFYTLALRGYEWSASSSSCLKPSERTKRLTQKISRLNMRKVRCSTYRDGRLMSLRVESISMYTLVPPFLLLVEAPDKISFWNCKQLLVVYSLNCFHTMKFFIFKIYFSQFKEQKKGIVSLIW